jgi:hypothetical protein
MLLGTVIQASAAPAKPIVRVDVRPESVGVGESAELRVTVLVPTWFTRPPVYPTFELANAITRLPPDSSYPTSERVGRETWSGIVRNYRFYPLLGASYRLPGETITVTYANPGSTPLTAEVAVPEISIRGVVPEGAEGLNPYLAGTRLTMKQTIDGGVEPLNVGDAVVVRLVTEMDGLPAIFLPPLLSRSSIDGISIYADTPQVDDGPPARREEQLTLVFDTPGTFTLPGTQLSWWNSESGRIEIASVEDLRFEVTGPTAPTAGVQTPDERALLGPAIAVTLVLVLGLVAWKAAPALALAMRKAAEARRRSEPYAFRQLRRSIVAGDRSATHADLLAWLTKLDVEQDARAFARVYGNERLVAAIDSLSAHLYGRSDADADPAELRRPLVAARRRYQQRPGGAKRAAGRLPALNP